MILISRTFFSKIQISIIIIYQTTLIIKIYRIFQVKNSTEHQKNIFFSQFITIMMYRSQNFFFDIAIRYHTIQNDIDRLGQKYIVEEAQYLLTIKSIITLRIIHILFNDILINKIYKPMAIIIIQYYTDNQNSKVYVL